MEDLVDRVKRRRKDRPDYSGGSPRLVAQEDFTSEDSSDSPDSSEEEQEEPPRSSERRATSTMSPQPQPQPQSQPEAATPQQEDPAVKPWKRALAKLVMAYLAALSSDTVEYGDRLLSLAEAERLFRVANLRNITAQVSLYKKGHKPDALTGDVWPEIPQAGQAVDPDIELFFTSMLEAEEEGGKIQRIKDEIAKENDPERAKKRGDLEKQVEECGNLLSKAFERLYSPIAKVNPQLPKPPKVKLLLHCSLVALLIDVLNRLVAIVVFLVEQNSILKDSHHLIMRLVAVAGREIANWATKDMQAVCKEHDIVIQEAPQDDYTAAMRELFSWASTNWVQLKLKAPESEELREAKQSLEEMIEWAKNAYADLKRAKGPAEAPAAEVDLNDS